MASRLAALQAALQGDIIGRTTLSAGRIRTPEGVSAERRIGVYQNAYRLRLAGILADEYPVLSAFMGERDFWRMAHRFIDACPSIHPNARMAPARLPGFLASDERYRDNAPVCEIAALEDGFSRAFDARDTRLATMDDLSAFPADRVAGMRVAFAPPVSLLTVTVNAVDICRTVWEGGSAPQAAALPEPARVLVWRQALGAKYRVLLAEEAMLVGEAMAGKDFAALCEMAAFMDDAETAPARLAGYLTAWIGADMVEALEQGETPPRSFSPG